MYRPSAARYAYLHAKRGLQLGAESSQQGASQLVTPQTAKTQMALVYALHAANVCIWHLHRSGKRAASCRRRRGLHPSVGVVKYNPQLRNKLT
jgi:hypothetical protein